jgi:hypothetical protein
MTRQHAWKKYHGSGELDRLLFLPEALDLLNPDEVWELAQEINRHDGSVRLIVIDNLARSMVGGDENAARDMGVVVDSVQILRQETGACVLLIHHTGKDKKEERGSSSLRAAADTVIRASRRGTTLKVSCEKQRDYEHFVDLEFQFQAVEGTDSGVLVRTSLTPVIRDRELKAAKLVPNKGLGHNAWRKAFQESGLGSKDEFRRDRETLVKRGIVAKAADTYCLTEMGIATVNGAKGAK